MTPWGFPGIVPEGLFLGPGVPHELKARLRKVQFATKILTLANSSSRRSHEI